MKAQPNHSERGHAEFSPSSLKYVAQCPAYEGRDGDSEASRKGTRIHEALEVRDPSALHDEEEVAIYEQIVAMEAEFMKNFSDVAEEHNEIRVHVDLFTTETWGTCDRLLILAGKTAAVMADYKTGISIIDPPDKNWQAKAYVLGAFQLFPELEQITFVFYVPLHHASLHHTFERKDMEQLRSELAQVVLAGEIARPKWAIGTVDMDDCKPSQYCRFCKHEDHCPALGGLVLDVARKLDSTVPDIDPTDLDNPARLSELYNIAKIVENWADTVKRRAVDAAKSGVELDGLVLRSMGRTRSISDNETLLKVAAEHGVPEDLLLQAANFPLGKVTKIVGERHDKKERREKEQLFVDACEDAGIITTSDERFTLAVSR